jgi:hypothetical protein
VQAAEIDEEFPVVGIDSPALEAARMLAEHSLPGIVVLTADGQLHAVLPASQVVRFIVRRGCCGLPTDQLGGSHDLLSGFVL